MFRQAGKLLLVGPYLEHGTKDLWQHRTTSPGAARARREYEARVQDLQREIDEAKEANEWVRADRAEVELGASVDQLTRAFG